MIVMWNAIAKNTVSGILQVSVLVVLLQFPGVAWSGAPGNAGQRDKVDARLIVTLNLPTGPVFAPTPSGRMSYFPPNPVTLRQQTHRQAKVVAENLGLILEDQWPIHALGVNCVVFRIPAGTDRNTVIRSLESTPVVDAVQDMNRFVVQSYPGPEAGSKDGVRNDQSLEYTGEGVSIAVVDTGAELSHEAIAAASVDSHDLVDSQAASLPPEQHGTAILGLLLANGNAAPGLRGLVPAAKVSLFRACWETDDEAAAVCNTFTLAKALAAVLESESEIVNLSISGPRDSLLERLGRLLIEDDRIIVAAGDSRDGFPGSISGSILAVDWPGSGEAMLTSLPGDRYGFKSGSSIDAARVSGIVAGLKQINRNLDSDVALQSAMTNFPLPSPENISAD